MAFLLIIAFVFSFAGDWGDILRSTPEKAEKAYENENFQKALELYQQSQVNKPDSDTLSYNLGNTYYRLGDYESAAKEYSHILDNQDAKLSSDGFYNMGNTLYQIGKTKNDQESLKKSLDAYKRSIQLDPEDKDSKYNYELVKKMLAQMQQQQQQQSDQNKQDKNNQDDKNQQQQQQQKDKQDQKQDKQNKDQQDGDKDKEQQKDKQDQQQGQSQQEQQAAADSSQNQQGQQMQEGKMSKEEAQRILDALIQMEKAEQLRQKKEQQKGRSQSGPDW